MSGWAIVAVLVVESCGNSNGPSGSNDASGPYGSLNDGAIANDAVSPSDGASADSAPADATPANDAPSDTAGDGAGSESCKTNADCGSGRACYGQTGAPCVGAGGGGVCVARLNATCSQTPGSGCPCLDVPQLGGGCNIGGDTCWGGDLGTQCWYCNVPQ